jgi:hypothetical protein
MNPKFSIIFCLLLTSLNVWGEDLSLDTHTTENGISKFCKNGEDSSDAQAIIEKINDKIKTKINNAKDITTQIDNLNAQKNILNGLNTLKDQYLDSLKNISTEERASIDEFKVLLKSSVTLSAVSMLVASKDKKTDITDIKSLCSDGANKNVSLCQAVNSGWWRNNSWYGNDPKLLQNSLNLTLNNFKDSYDHVKEEDKAKLNSDLDSFFTSLNGKENVSPNTTIEILNKSPNLISALANGDRDSIEKCLKDDIQSCTNLMTKSSNRNTFVENINSELKSLNQNFTTDKYKQFFENYDKRENSGTKFQSLVKNISKKATDIFGSSQKQQSVLDPELQKNVKKYCDEDSESYNIDECLKNNQALVDNIKSNTDKNEAELKKLNEQLAAVLNKDGSLEALEKMKKYIGDKYFRSCPNADSSPSIADEAVKGVCSALYTNAPETSMNLSGKISDIVGKLSSDNKVSTKRGELGAFSKQELNTYANYCQNSSLTSDKLLQGVCGDIYKELNRIAKQKEAKDWDQFYDKYWVEYNPRSKNGYDVYEKKSNLRIVGEGVSQSIGKIYPIWMNNQQLNYQIDFMTNQALYQKQLNYMYSYGSPWMNYSYFQGAYFNSNFNTSNPFLWTTGTTGTTTSTTVPKTGGFSF